MRAPTTLTFCRDTPAAVRDEANRLYAEARPGSWRMRVIERLAGDDRMNKVWQKLKRYNAADLARVFELACNPVIAQIAPRHLARQRAGHCAQMFTRLRKLAETLEKHPELQVFAASDMGTDPEVLRGAAEIYTVLMDRNMYLSAERYKKVKSAARFLASLLSGKMKSSFRNSFDPVVADIISVALNSEIDERTVKFWRTVSKAKKPR